MGSASLTHELFTEHYPVLRAALKQYLASLTVTNANLRRFPDRIALSASTGDLSTMLGSEMDQATAALLLVEDINRKLEEEGVYHAPVPGDDQGVVDPLGHVR